MERPFWIECKNFDDTAADLREINQFVDSNDKDDNHSLVADVDPKELLSIVKFDPRKGKAPGHDTITHELLRLAIGTPFCIHPAKLITLSLRVVYIPTAWKLATLCMLIKPDKLPSLTTRYRPISLLSAIIMKLFERVIECLRKHLEDTTFLSKYQSGFRKVKSTNYHLFRLSQTVMESFNRGEQVIASFLDVEKAFDNIWHNALRYIILQLGLPTKVTRWLFDFLVLRVIQVKVDGFLSSKIYPKAGVPQGSVLSPLLFLIYVNDMPDPKHHLNSKSQFADDAGLWAGSKKASVAANRLQRNLQLDALVEWCPKWRIKLNHEKNQINHVLRDPKGNCK